MIIENQTKWTLGFVSILAAIILSGGIALAQTAPTTPATATTKPSDYAVDVSQGQQTLQTDPAAADQAKNVNDSENDEGNVDDGEVEVNEQVEQGEATEQSDNKDSSDSSSSSASGSSTERSGSNNGN